MSEFEKVKRSCLKQGQLYEDPEFPANQSSVFYHQTPPFQFTWIRPKDVIPNPVFVTDGPSQFDIVPGKLGDRWFVSCLGCLYLTRGLFYRVVPADQSFDDENYAGIFRFRIWWCGEWLEVTVDDRLPTVNNRLVFVQAQHSNQMWPALLEKAYAKLHGSYEALKYGCSLDGLADLTGGITESINVRQDPNSCCRMLGKVLEMTSVVTCVVLQTQTRNQPEKLSNGILIGTNYRILSLDKVETFSGEQIHLIHLKNHMTIASEYVGPWARDSIEWDEVPNEEKERLNIKYASEGEIWMAYQDFVKTFTHLEIAHLDGETSKDEPSLRNKSAWQMRMWQGAWQKGVTAGGCRNNADTFHLNPQFHLIISDIEDVVISLNQHRHLEPKVIGFTIYHLPKNSTDSIDRTFFKKNKSLANSQYTNSRQVTQRCHLEQGSYMVLPTTFEPGQEASFTLRVYSSKPLKLKLIDSTPSITKPAILKAPPSTDGKGLNQYEAVFMQLAEEHKTINAFELQELLEAVLPNDYVKSCASLEVCRQVVLTLDSSGTGRLKFSDFKDFMCSLKYWQNTFKNHTKGTTGILRAERLKDALTEVGFQLNMELISLLVIRYMRKDGTLRFGDFVAAILHLTMAFAMFEKKDPLQNGYVKLNLTEWLKTCLVC
ncbi:hypothetical protein CHUAL_012668 [Chamberlinius hualienensis]